MIDLLEPSAAAVWPEPARGCFLLQPRLKPEEGDFGLVAQHTVDLMRVGDERCDLLILTERVVCSRRPFLQEDGVSFTSEQINAVALFLSARGRGSNNVFGVNQWRREDGCGDEAAEKRRINVF